MYNINPFINKQLTDNSNCYIKMSISKTHESKNHFQFSESIQLPLGYFPISQKLQTLKRQTKDLAICFEDFKQETINEFNKAMGRISSLIQREISTNHQLREQLDIVKYTNQTMKKQVVQLREMIQDFVKSYNTEIEAKDVEIKQLKSQLGMQAQQKENSLFLGADEIQPKINSLEIIQQVSEYTGSCIQSIREISIPNSAKGSIIPVNQNESNMTETHEDSWAEEDNKTNKSKSYLNFFRKNIDESVLVFEQKYKEKKQKQVQSHSNSIDDAYLGETDKINLPKTIKSPKNMQFLKKSQANFSIEESKQNCSFIQLKTPHHRRNNSNLSQGQAKCKSECKSEKNSRSNSKAGSKQKIKVTSKIIQQSNNFNTQKNYKKSAITLRPSVHLGGKMYLKKLVKQVKAALHEYKVWEGTRSKQVKYEGERKNGKRWGKGKLLYDNGFEYDGTFVENYKHGTGIISLNGIVFYEGQWSLDEISGQGYIKSLKNYSQSSSKYLSEASYCGQLLENKMHGMGTLFLNQNQKIITKFVHGLPIGDFTYYNHSEIEFGSWY